MNVESIVPKNKDTRYIDAKIGNRQAFKIVPMQQLWTTARHWTYSYHNNQALVHLIISYYSF